MNGCERPQVLFDYLQQELPQDLIIHIDAHLLHCAACRRELEYLRLQIQQVRTTLARLNPAEESPAKARPDFIASPRSLSINPLARLAAAIAAAFMLIVGAALHLSGHESTLASTLSQLKELVDVSTNLYAATTMDCNVRIPDSAGADKKYRIRWASRGISRVDLDPNDGTERTLWTSGTIMASDPVWQPASEFLTPAILARNMEEKYGLMRTGRRQDSRQNNVLLTGQKDRQIIEIEVDRITFLPKMLKKYEEEPGGRARQRRCLEEVQFLWNQPIPRSIFVRGSHNAK